MPRWRPQKVDCVGGNTVVTFFDHGDGEEQTVGYPGIGGASALATPRSCFGSITWGRRALEFLGVMCRCFQVKAQRLGANDGDACGCRNSLGGVVVGIRPAVQLRVKTLDLAVLMMAAQCVITLLGASSWSPV
jgi:hypothetical protein